MVEDNALNGECKLSSNQSTTAFNGADRSECPFMIRKEHFRHEVNIKQIAWLNIIGGSLFLAIGVLAVVAMFNRYEPQSGEPANVAMLFMGLVGGGAALWTGIALRRLKPWARFAMSILYVPNLLFIPVGTVIGGWFIWTLLHKKAKYICSNEYQDVLAATSEIKWNRRWKHQEHLMAPQEEDALRKAA